MCRARHQRRCQRIAIYIAIAPSQVSDDTGCGCPNRQRRVFVRRVAVVDGDRRVVNRRDAERHGCQGFFALTVDDLVGEAIWPVVVGVRRVRERAVGAENDGTVRWACRDRPADGIAIWITIVADDRAGNGRVFSAGERVVARSWCRVDDVPNESLYRGGPAWIFRGDCDVPDRSRCQMINRAGDQPGVGINREACRQSRCGEGQDIAVDIREIAGNAERNNVFVVVGWRRDGCRNRRVVDRLDGDDDGLGLGRAIAVGDGVGEAIRAVEVQGRDVGIVAEAIDSHCAVRRVACFGVGQRIAIGIAIVARDRTVEHGVFVGRRGIVASSWHRICNSDIKRDRGLAAVQVVGVNRHVINAAGHALRRGVIDRAGDDTGRRIDR